MRWNDVSKDALGGDRPKRTHDEIHNDVERMRAIIGPILPIFFWRSASYVDRILKGEPPGNSASSIPGPNCEMSA